MNAWKQLTTGPWLVPLGRALLCFVLSLVWVIVSLPFFFGGTGFNVFMQVVLVVVMLATLYFLAKAVFVLVKNKKTKEKISKTEYLLVKTSFRLVYLYIGLMLFGTIANAINFDAMPVMEVLILIGGLPHQVLDFFSLGPVIGVSLWSAVKTALANLLAFVWVGVILHGVAKLVHKVTGSKDNMAEFVDASTKMPWEYARGRAMQFLIVVLVVLALFFVTGVAANYERISFCSCVPEAVDGYSLKECDSPYEDTVFVRYTKPNECKQCGYIPTPYSLKITAGPWPMESIEETSILDYPVLEEREYENFFGYNAEFVRTVGGTQVTFSKNGKRVVVTEGTPFASMSMSMPPKANPDFDFESVDGLESVLACI